MRHSLTLLFVFALAPHAMSQNFGVPLERQSMTAFFEADFGMTTFESQTAGSKETSETKSWRIGTAAGKERRLSITFASSENNVPFTLNNSEMVSNWKELTMKTRMGWFHPIIAASLNELEINTNQTNIVDIYSASLGLGMEVKVPLWNRVVASVKGVSYSPTTPTNREIGKLGTRTEFETSAAVDVTSHILDFLVGYRHREYTLEISDTVNEESQQGAFIGLRMGVYF